MDGGPFVFPPRPAGMKFCDCAVQRERVDSDSDDLFFLERHEHGIQNASLGPAVHPGVDDVPAAESLRQCAPLTPALGDVKDRVGNIQDRDLDVSLLCGEASFNASKLIFGDHHALKTINAFGDPLNPGARAQSTRVAQGAPFAAVPLLLQRPLRDPSSAVAPGRGSTPGAPRCGGRWAGRIGPGAPAPDPLTPGRPAWPPASRCS